MDRKYTFSLKTVNKYCYNEIWGYNTKSDIIEQEIKSYLYHADHEQYLEILLEKSSTIESHIGNLYCIMEFFMAEEQNHDQNLFQMTILYEELKRMYLLMKIKESPDDKFKDAEIAVSPSSNNPFKFLSTEIDLNRKLIESLSREYKAHFNKNYGFMYFNLFNHELALDNITAKELLSITNELKTKEIHLKFHKINLEKDMIKIVLDYVNNETNLNPRGLKMTKPLATVIYYILSIFKVITKPQKESDITNYIRDMHKNPKLSV